jgi:hypothetical protein
MPRVVAAKFGGGAADLIDKESPSRQTTIVSPS